MNTDGIKNGLAEIFNRMPVVRLLRGEDESDWSKNGLMRALKGMPVFQNDAGQSAYDAAMNIGPMGLGKIVYHGSPHKFDKFDASKIGTGEGAQAYGHGVYLADAKEVADGYARVLGGREFDIGGRKIYATSGGSTRALDQQAMHEKIAADALDDALNAQSSSPAQFAANRLRQQKKLYPDQATDIDKAMNVIADWQERGATQQITGQTYKADLPDEWIPKMLDWDKSLSQQPENVRLLAKDLGLAKDATGKDVYSALSNQARDMGIIKGRAAQTTLPGSQGRAAADLSEFGIPGIRYLDGGSRVAGQGSYNYVVFPGLEDKVKILERNGQPVNALAEILK